MGEEVCMNGCGVLRSPMAGWAHWLGNESNHGTANGPSQSGPIHFATAARKLIPRTEVDPLPLVVDGTRIVIAGQAIWQKGSAGYEMFQLPVSLVNQPWKAVGGQGHLYLVGEGELLIWDIAMRKIESRFPVLNIIGQAISNGDWIGVRNGTDGPEALTLKNGQVRSISTKAGSASSCSITTLNRVPYGLMSGGELINLYDGSLAGAVDTIDPARSTLLAWGETLVASDGR